MACKYLIKLRSGEVIELPSSLQSNSQFTFQDFRDVLHSLPKEKLSEIIDTITNSENIPIEVKSLNLKNIIKTTTLGNLKYFNSNLYYRDPVTAQLYSNSKHLIDLLDNAGENLRSHSIIYTNTQSKFDPNYGNAYDLESNTFIINSDSIGTMNFVALNKGLIDMYILKYSKNLQDIIKTQFSDVKEFVENMPFLYRKHKINQNILTSIKTELGISEEIFDYIYDSHSENIKNNDIYTGKTTEDIKLFADYISNKYGDLQKGDNRKYYYSDSESSKSYPILNAGDLIKIKSKNYKNGIFGIYLDHYELNNKRHYIVLFPGNPNIYQSFVEDELKFNGEFIYQKNIINTSAEHIAFDNTSTLNIIDAENSAFIDLKNERVPEDLIKLLKKGDKFIYQFVDKSTGKINKLKKEVIDIVGNTLLYRDNVKNSEIKKLLIGGKSFISAIEFDLRNHQELKDFDVQLFRKERIKNKLSFPLIELDSNNREKEISQLNKGDIVLTKMSNGEGAYHNYYIGDIDENNIITLGKSSGQIVMIVIPKNNIIGIINDISEHKTLIENYDKLITSINRSFDVDVLSNDNKQLKGDDLDTNNNTRFSVYSVDNKSKLSDELKKNIETGDYVRIGKINYLVLENNDGNLKLYNNGKLDKFHISKVLKILKTTLEPTIYTQKTLQMNARLVDTKSFFDEKFANTSFEIVPVKYVIENKFKDSYNWENGFVKQGFFMDENFYNGIDKEGTKRMDKFLDISHEYASQNLEEGNKLFTIKRNGAFITNTSGTNRYDIHALSAQEAIKLLSVGSYISLINNYRIYRIEEILDTELIVSYAYRDTNGNIVKNIETLPVNKLVKNESENNIFSLFVPIVQTKVNENLKNYKESLNKKTQELVTEKDSVEVLKMISEYMKEKFNIDIILGSLNDFKNIEELNSVSMIESAKSFLKNGKIYVNLDFASLSDPIHEISHLITGTLKVLNPKLYEQLLLKVKLNEELLTEINNKYNNLTYYELLEEAFAESFGKNIIGELQSKEFNDDTLLEGVNTIMNNMFNFSEKSNNTSKLLTTPLYQLINEFGSNFVTNPESLYDRNASLLAENITKAKKELMDINKLKEKCK